MEEHARKSGQSDPLAKFLTGVIEFFDRCLRIMWTLIKHPWNLKHVSDEEMASGPHPYVFYVVCLYVGTFLICAILPHVSNNLVRGLIEEQKQGFQGWLNSLCAEHFTNINAQGLTRDWKLNFFSSLPWAIPALVIVHLFSRVLTRLSRSALLIRRTLVSRSLFYYAGFSELLLGIAFTTASWLVPAVGPQDVKESLGWFRLIVLPFYLAAILFGASIVDWSTAKQQGHRLRAILLYLGGFVYFLLLEAVQEVFAVLYVDVFRIPLFR
jgi:hypothetical protein